MDFQLDQKHEMARRLFQQFAENEVKPHARTVPAREYREDGKVRIPRNSV